MDIKPALCGDLPSVLKLIQDQFAYMEGRIDPPSSMHDLTVADLKISEVWVLGSPVFACMVTTEKPNALYLGKLAIKPACRGQGVLELFVSHADRLALKLGKPVLELESRIELTEVHAAFHRVGFRETGRGAHRGYACDTYITMQRPVVQAP